jgi:hypothetical protein
MKKGRFGLSFNVSQLLEDHLVGRSSVGASGVGSHWVLRSIIAQPWEGLVNANLGQYFAVMQQNHL